MKRKPMGILLIVFGAVCVIAGTIICVTDRSQPVHEPVVTVRVPDTVAEPEPVRPSVPSQAPRPAQPPVTTPEPVRPVQPVTDSDDSHAKGEAFEQYIVSKFSKKYWTIREWRSDKGMDGRYAESAMKPDLVMCLNLKDDKYPVAVECKWRKEAKDGKIKWSYPEQLERYRSFASESDAPVFVAIGLGGTPASPENVFLVPLASLRSHVTEVDYLQRFAHDPAKDIYYDTERGRLR